MTKRRPSCVYAEQPLLVSCAAGSGKSCIAHLIATGAPPKGARQTVGCSTSVVLVEPADTSGLGDARQQRPVFLELWDIGGFTCHQGALRKYERCPNVMLRCTSACVSCGPNLADMSVWHLEVHSEYGAHKMTTFTFKSLPDDPFHLHGCRWS